MSYLSGKNTQNTSIHSNERGAIMLEVIAVLALMGVMGAMLFRQIYQRNQELHNIQMASEIRSVKEAFSAYIQANRAQILSACKAANPDINEVRQCGTSPDGGFGAADLAASIKPYLPDGWFADTPPNPDGTDLNSFYDFKLFTFTQNDVTGRRMLYGVVIPKSTTLPATGWNFKRAARVALLIGADGGAFDPEITRDGGNSIIAGSLGSWSLMARSLIGGTNNVGGCSCSSGACNSICEPIYAAITGLDIFAPEYELPKQEVNLPGPWSLALDRLHAANFFAVGGSSPACYSISHNTSTAGTVNSDTVNLPTSGGTCQPLFWVGSGSSPGSNDGNVYVKNDLRVGVTPGQTTGAIRLDDSGIVVMEKATVADPQRTDGKSITYLLDPQYTSVMNDIKIMSRGGAKLSDILPNYILKDVKAYTKTIATGSSGTNIEIPKPKCPTDYNKAVILIPQNFGGQLGYKPNDNTGSTDGHSHSISTTSIQLQIGSGDISDGSEGASSEGKWTINIKFSGTPKSTENMRFIAQTYCVWNESAFNGTTLPELPPANRTTYEQAKTESECLSYGGTWHPAVGTVAAYCAAS